MFRVNPYNIIKYSNKKTLYTTNDLVKMINEGTLTQDFIKLTTINTPTPKLKIKYKKYTPTTRNPHGHNEFVDNFYQGNYPYPFIRVENGTIIVHYSASTSTTKYFMRNESSFNVYILNFLLGEYKNHLVFLTIITKTNPTNIEDYITDTMITTINTENLHYDYITIKTTQELECVNDITEIVEVLINKDEYVIDYLYNLQNILNNTIEYIHNNTPENWTIKDITTSDTYTIDKKLTLYINNGKFNINYIFYIDYITTNCILSKLYVYETVKQYYEQVEEKLKTYYNKSIEIIKRITNIENTLLKVLSTSFIINNEEMTCEINLQNYKKIRVLINGDRTQVLTLPRFELEYYNEDEVIEFINNIINTLFEYCDYKILKTNNEIYVKTYECEM